MKPEEVARGVVFLCEDGSDCITGTILSIDGGSQLPWWSKRGTGEF
jgi:glucose 1-dehydrogenase